MTNKIEFKPWPKIPRHDKEDYIGITEKMDGTNSCIVIDDGLIVAVQSRKRFITPEDDNFGFAKWVVNNNEALLSLGDGYHYGEWVGQGIQGNPHNLEDKRLFLFNVQRWGEHNPNTPKVVSVVRVLYNGPESKTIVDETMQELLNIADVEKYTPEGVISFNFRTKCYVKTTFKNNHGKWVKKYLQNSG